MTREIRPSGADTWMVCQGSPALVEKLIDEGKIPAEETSEYASLGTAAHTLGQICLEDGSTPRDHEGEMITADGKEFEVDDNMIHAVEAYVEDVRRKAYGKRLMVEAVVPVGHLTRQQGQTGQADSIIISKKGKTTLEIDDYKHGQGIEVFAEKNRQMLIYACGVVSKMLGNKKLPERITLTIHQPRIKSAPDSWTVSLANVKKFGRKAIAAAKRARSLKPGEGLKPGPKQCQWCKAKPFCDALHGQVAMVFDDIDDMTDTVQLPEEYKELSARYMRLPLVEMWAKSVKETVHGLLDRGERVPDLKLVPGRRGNRAWGDEKEATAALQKLRLRKDQMFDQKLISPAKVESLLTDRQMSRLNEAGLIVQSEGKPTVAPSDDPRDEIVREQVFDNIE